MMQFLTSEKRTVFFGFAFVTASVLLLSSPSLGADEDVVDAVDPKALIESLLNAKDETSKVKAIDDLASLHSQAKGAIDPISELMKDPLPRVRWHAARALGMIGVDAITKIPDLIKLLDDSDALTKTQAAAALGNIREDDENVSEENALVYRDAAESILKVMLDKDPRVRRAAMRSLRWFKIDPEKLIPAISAQLENADPSVIVPALQTMADIGVDAIPILVKSLENPKSAYWATVALMGMNAVAAPAVPQLTILAESGETEERMQAILALASIGEPAKTASKVLLESLASKEPSIQYASAYAIGVIRVAGATNALQKLTRSTDPFLKEISWWALARVNPTDKKIAQQAVQALHAALSNENPNFRRAAIEGLANLDGIAKESIAPDFVAALTDKDVAVQSAAAESLFRMGSASVGVLSKSLGDPERRLIAIDILSSLGKEALPAMDIFIKGLSDKDPQFRGDCAMGLAGIGSGSLKSVPNLIKLLDDDDTGARVSASYALGRIGVGAQAAIPKLLLLASSEEKMGAPVASWALLKIDPSNKDFIQSAIPKLRTALRSPMEMIRLEAAIALGEVGQPAREAVPILELIADDDPVPSVRSAAADALTKIRGS